MTPHDPAYYQTPPPLSKCSSPTLSAIFAYRAYQLDPIMQPPPTLAQVRLIACYLYEYIHAPVFTYPADELKRLRASAEHIVTVRHLADWLWDCRKIGLEPL